MSHPMRTPTNLAIPMQRDRQRDFARASGEDLLRAKVAQVLLTAGELPWRPEFGAGLDRLRHRRNDAVLEELARVAVRDAFARWLPSVQLVELRAVGEGDALRLHVRVREGASEARIEVAP
jgi:phage baseplate assembly protein W